MTFEQITKSLQVAGALPKPRKRIQVQFEIPRDWEDTFVPVKEGKRTVLVWKPF